MKPFDCYQFIENVRKSCIMSEDWVDLMRRGACLIGGVIVVLMYTFSFEIFLLYVLCVLVYFADLFINSFYLVSINEIIELSGVWSYFLSLELYVFS